MTLESLLRDAAPTEVAFTHDDVRTRVTQVRKRRRRALAGLGALFVLVGGLGAWALLRHDEPTSVVAGPPDLTGTLPITDDALVGSTWVATDSDTGIVPSIRFQGRPRLAFAGECSGPWSIVDGEIVFEWGSSLLSSGNPCGTTAIFTGRPTLFADGRLVFDGVTLRRLEAIGRPATRNDLLGQWHTPDNDIDVAFGETIQVGACQFPFVFEDGLMRSYNASCDYAYGTTSMFADTVLHGRATVDGDDLWMTTPQTTVRLVRGPSGVDSNVLLTDGLWVPVDADRLVDLPTIEFIAGGAFRASGSCNTWSGRWDLVDGRPVVEINSRTTAYCSSDQEADDELIAGAADGGEFDLDDRVLNVGGVPFRQLSGSYTLTVPEWLMGRWTTADDHAVEFAEDRLTIDDTCAAFAWELRASALRYQGTSSCRIAVDPLSVERLGLDSMVVDVRLVGDNLYLIHETDQVVVYHRLPSAEGGEHLLYQAIGHLLVDPRWESADDLDGQHLLGFEWGGEDVDAIAVPIEDAAAPADDEHSFTCGAYRVIADGSQGAADALFGALDCASG